MRKFKTMFTALALGFVFALSGCNGNSENNSATSAPDFSETVETTDLYDYEGKTEKEFQFKTFIGVPSNMRIYNALETSFYVKTLTDEELDAYYKELSEAGFTVADGPYFPEDQAHYRKVLDLAQKYGMKQMVGELVVNGISLSGMLRGEIIDSATGKPVEYTDEQIKAHLEACLGEFKNHPAFYGFSYWDEPNATKYDTIARMQKLFQEVFPGKILYVNLLPITTELSLLGYTNPRTDSNMPLILLKKWMSLIFPMTVILCMKMQAREKGKFKRTSCITCRFIVKRPIPMDENFGRICNRRDILAPKPDISNRRELPICVGR